MTQFDQISKDFFVNTDFVDCLEATGLTSFDAVFGFNSGHNLQKANMAGYRTRITFEACGKTFFLKQYQNLPKLAQIKNWLKRKVRRSMMSCDLRPATQLQAAGINTPTTVAFGAQWAWGFEKRSFIISEKVPGESLEKKLPDYVLKPTGENVEKKKQFITQLAEFVKKFHETGFRHRDLYLCHIFFAESDNFTLIDLHRAFQPCLFANRFRLKDIAQLYYSASGSVFSRSDRLRFYLAYTGVKKLSNRDKRFIKKVKSKAQRIARHDARHGRSIPFAN